MDFLYYNRLFTKLVRRLSNGRPQAVRVEEVSFFDGEMDFFNRLRNCDFFFMAGF